MTSSNYPYVRDEKELLSAYQELQRLREVEDIPDFENLDQIYVSGRSTTRVPSSATDVLATDQVGDVVSDATYEYKLMDLGGGIIKWDRRTLDTSW